MNVSITAGSTDSESLVRGPRGIAQGTRSQESLLGRVRTRLQGDRTENTESAGQPPPYEESAQGAGHSNAGAEFSDTDLHLPAYHDITGPLPRWNEEKGCFEEEKPPTYEEATKTKSPRR